MRPGTRGSPIVKASNAYHDNANNQAVLEWSSIMERDHQAIHIGTASPCIRLESIEIAKQVKSCLVMIVPSQCNPRARECCVDSFVCQSLITPAATGPSHAHDLESSALSRRHDVLLLWTPHAGARRSRRMLRTRREGIPYDTVGALER